MEFKLDIKVSDFSKEVTEKIKDSISKDLQNTVDTLSKGAYQHASQLADKNLSGKMKDIYQQNLYIEKISDFVTEVGLRQEANWIEEGRKSGFMEELLKGPNVKTSKDGKKYNIIPFKHDTSSKNNIESSQKLVDELKNFFKKEGIPYSKTRALQMDQNGNPRIGKIHSFNIKEMRDGKKKSVENLTPNLQGISVYQNMNEKTGKVERSIMTFRVISEKHRGTGKWEHPGRSGEKIIEETYKWVQDKWQTELLPELKKKYEK